jgi:hypothetical protein
MSLSGRTRLSRNTVKKVILMGLMALYCFESYSFSRILLAMEILDGQFISDEQILKKRKLIVWLHLTIRLSERVQIVQIVHKYVRR